MCGLTVVAVFAGMAFAAMAFTRSGLLLAVADDSDMKIAPAYPSRRVVHENSEFEKKELQRHRENGNLERARKLAEEYAQLLFSLSKGSAQEQGNEAAIEQECILFCFILYEMLREYPVPVVGAKVRQEFDDLVQERDANLFRLVTNPEAVTLYTLCGGSDERMGATFAKLCEKEHDPAFAMLGSAFVDRYRKLCANLLRSSGLQV